MVGTSKILTVSYGTFSCTLEGFDDSFGTMKAIAEYFRDLASDDRYFGAEPPTPDAEMLAQIAGREISRRVDASMNDDGIHLRAATLTDQSDDAPKSAESRHDADSRAAVVAERKAAKEAHRAKKMAERKAAKAEAKAVRVAEKAEAKEKAKVEARAKAQADAKVESDAKAEADAKAATASDIPVEASAGTTQIESSESPATAELAEGTPGSEVEETRTVTPPSMLAAQDPAPTQTAPPAEQPTAHSDSGSIAAKLQRIRAVVGSSDNATNAPSDDLTAQFLPQSEIPDVTDVDSGQSQDAPSEKVDSSLKGSSQNVTAKSDALAEFDAHEAEMETATQNAEAEAVAPKTAEPQARIIRMKRADFDKAVQDGEMRAPDAPQAPKESPNLGQLDGADDLDEYLEDSDFTDSDLSALDDKDFTDDLAAIKADVEEGSTPEAPVDVARDNAGDKAALNAVANAMAAQDEDVPVADVKVEAETPEPASTFIDDDPQVDGAALDRLMSESDAQMQEPEGSRRRDAIAQLKAAVAAKEAARQVGEPDDDGQDVENAFRNDLSEAVGPRAGTARPRPVVRPEARTERPRPAPLKLVAAQRVDLDRGEQHDGPVVPRRVAATKGVAQTAEAGSFAEFAENMGASELPDLLEAAAAYTSFIEGADEFSRPQILRRVRSVTSDEFNREDGLRSFADLLKLGRITKVRNGRFQVADDSRYNPERRAG